MTTKIFQIDRLPKFLRYKAFLGTFGTGALLKSNNVETSQCRPGKNHKRFGNSPSV